MRESLFCWSCNYYSWILWPNAWPSFLLTPACGNWLNSQMQKTFHVKPLTRIRFFSPTRSSTVNFTPAIFCFYIHLLNYSSSLKLISINSILCKVRLANKWVFFAFKFWNKYLKFNNIKLVINTIITVICFFLFLNLIMKCQNRNIMCKWYWHNVFVERG